MSYFTIISFVLCTAAVGGLTWIMTRKDDHGSSVGYFLGGRSLTAGFIAGSLMLTNLSTEQLVGLNGAAFTFGLSVMVWEVVATTGLVMMALFFLPKFLKSGIATVPQFLEYRFGRSTRSITTGIFIIAYAAILLPIILYTGATGMNSILNLKTITGVESEVTNIWIAVWAIGILGSVYAIFGGLRTVAVSDTINGGGLLVGGIMITVFGLSYIGGESGMMAGLDMVRSAHPDKWNSIGSSSSQVPFLTIFTGVMTLNLFYWCTNQQIIQRTFGASSLKEGQKGVLMAGGLKVLAPLILVVPGLLAFYMNSKGIITVDRADKAYGLLVQKVMPSYLNGFFAAVLLGAILSSFNSALNSTCTMFSLGIYKGIVKPDASEQTVIRSGKWFGWIIAVAAMFIAPLLLNAKGIFGYLQTMNAIYFVPILAVVAVGLVTKRVPAFAANIGLVVAFAVLIGINFVPGLKEITNPQSTLFFAHYFHCIAIILVATIALILILGTAKPLDKPWVHEYSGDVDLTPWRYARQAAVALLAVVFGLYAVFADFSVLKGIPKIEIVYAIVFMSLLAWGLYRLKDQTGDAGTAVPGGITKK